ncbi:hypothetical protein ACVWYZ_000158 [Thermostichus sp. MS-CIW-37]
MNWLTLLGLLCLPGSLFSCVEYLRSQRLVQQLSTTRLLKVAELRNLGQTSPQAKGANLAQVYGRILCNRPLVSEFSRQPCVYYKSEISWEYDEVECYRKYLNSEGDVTYSERISEGEYQNALRLGSRAKSYPGRMTAKEPGLGYSAPSSFQKRVDPGYSDSFPQKSNPGYFGAASFPQKTGSGYPGSDAFQKKPGYPDYPQKLGSPAYPEKWPFSEAGSPQKYYNNVYSDPSTGREYLLERETRTRDETLHSVVRQIPFFIEDETGRVRVDPTGAEVEAMAVVDERVFPGKGPSRFNFDLKRYLSQVRTENRSTRSFIYKEWVIPVDAMAFAMGQVRFEAGDPVIRKPLSGGRFMIAPKSPEALLEEQRSNASSYLVLSIVLLGIGVFTVLYLLQSLQPYR